MVLQDSMNMNDPFVEFSTPDNKEHVTIETSPQKTSFEILIDSKESYKPDGFEISKIEFFGNFGVVTLSKQGEKDYICGT